MAEEKTLGDILAEVRAEKGEAPRTEPLELWLPGLAILLSLLMTPIFGAYIHMENWSELRERDRARRSRLFFLISLIVVGGGFILSRLEENDAYYGITSFGMLLIWYVADARMQVKYFKEHVGNNFRRKSWLRAIAVAIAAFFALSFVAMGLNDFVFHVG